jgi:hypothetical protein
VDEYDEFGRESRIDRFTHRSLSVASALGARIGHDVEHVHDTCCAEFPFKFLLMSVALGVAAGMHGSMHMH